MSDGKTKVADGAGTIRLDQDILWLEIPVRYGGLTLSAHDFHVQVSQSRGYGQGHSNHTIRVHRRTIEVVEERTLLVVVRNQPKLRPSSVVWNFEKLISL